ncbi:MAG: hypothetical protein AAB229_09940 [Candidatus Hydrogenedentota bacterium]
MTLPPSDPRQEATASVVDPGRKIRAREEMDGLVINTELTLISIIQGSALYWVINGGFMHFNRAGVQYWPYIASGLLIILLFWSRALIHTFTLIRWPIEYGHNFLYIVCTFVESVMFTQLADPAAWHLWGMIFWGTVSFLFWFDMRMIHERMREKSGPRSVELYRILETEQVLNMKFVMPGVTIFYAASWAAIGHWPVYFIEEKGHQVLGWLQLLSLSVYQGYVLWFFKRITTLILEHRQEEE